ncbi:MAG: cupredoxin domain-containing protein [Actinomycetota bacterium]|nr:cupredoxin domain-containing protein [Actinomycetota bacterium]
MSTRQLAPFLGLALAIVASTAGMAGAAGKTVTLKDIRFSSPRVAISKGTVVTFRFLDADTTHNVTSVGKKRFQSISDRESGSKRVRFATAGTYRYVCTLHPGMSGRITVR